MAWHRAFKNWWSLHGSGQSVSLFQGPSVSVSVSVASSLGSVWLLPSMFCSGNAAAA
jgi:hypothetical protein